ncbi:hypothetical protein F4561_002319 [Lipingzhangella halophila]|uniref:Uncharacterized protein n=1 Tax=Lipingzhangella halophila TaxID=1783352 RepID=A0A7W7W367_9ACTN|nr:hypothetical protein [Lipingzhangella halophila]
MKVAPGRGYGDGLRGICEGGPYQPLAGMALTGRVRFRHRGPAW